MYKLSDGAASAPKESRKTIGDWILIVTAVGLLSALAVLIVFVFSLALFGVVTTLGAV